jgi:2-polyprenyl-6-methoxyphenol hydroxylase-like FAD-dependent oxidoreductase
MELLDELGLGERFSRLPQSRLTRIALPTGDGRQIVVGDLGRLKVRYPYIAMVPQWDLLDLLADAARQEPSSGHSAVAIRVAVELKRYLPTRPATGSRTDRWRGLRQGGSCGRWPPPAVPDQLAAF